MAFIVLFLLEITLLLFLSKVLTLSLAGFFYSLTRSHSATVNLLAILFLPGTILHELAHLLTAGIMLVPVGDLEVIPVISDNGVQLGSVQIGQTDPIRRMLIGFAPIFFGVLVILGIIYLSLPVLENHVVWWQVTLVIYAIFVVGNTMFSSKKDLEGTLVFLLTLTMVSGILLVVGQFSGFIHWSNLVQWILAVNLSSTENFFKAADIYLLIPLVIDLSLILILKAGQKGQ